MKVSNILQSQNFTALKLKRGSSFYLKRLSRADRQAIFIAKEKMKDFKYVDLTVGLRGMRIEPINNQFFEANWADVLAYQNLGVYCKTNMAIYGKPNKNSDSTIFLPFAVYEDAKNRASLFDDLSDVEKSIELAKEIEQFCSNEVYINSNLNKERLI